MSFTVLIVIAIGVLAVFTFTSSARLSSDRGSNRKGAKRGEVSDNLVFNGSPPASVGLRYGVPLQPAVDRLEQAFAEGEYAERIKYRVLQRHSRITSSEYDWHLVELKRYFLIVAVLKNVPMFSSRVDDIWHEMLLFTREYQQFCDKFIGFAVHHAPYLKASPMPEEKAWFDWVYAQLFVPMTYSSRIWQGFFQGPLGIDHIEELERLQPDALKQSLFNGRSVDMHREVELTVDWLIREAKRQIQQAYLNKQSNLQNQSLGSSGRTEGFGGTDFSSIAGAMLLFSVLQPTDYAKQMNEMLNEQKRAAESSTDTMAGDGAYSDIVGNIEIDNDSSDQQSHDASGNESDPGSDSSGEWFGYGSDGGSSGGNDSNDGGGGDGGGSEGSGSSSD